MQALIPAMSGTGPSISPVVTDEMARLNALHAYDILDTVAEISFDRLARAAADLCDAPMALVSLVDEGRQWFKARVGVEVGELPRGMAFCAHAIQADTLFVVPDATCDVRFADNPLVTGDLGLRFYAGAPLITAEGHRLGALCILDSSSRVDGLTDTQSRVLVALAAQVVSELELRRALSDLRWSLHHDALTTLPNRLLFHARLETELAISAASGGNRRIGLALLDLDHFKQVNDIYGHRAGDELLRAVAERLRGFVGPGETAARLGGDEFTIVLPDCGGDEAVERRLADLLKLLAEPFDFEGHLLDSRGSIGVACFPDQGRDAATLLKHADIAMYRAKAAGRGTTWMYRPSLSTALERRIEIIDSTRAAIRSGNIFPYYQAQYSLVTGEIVGCEALLRMRGPDGALHLPAEIDEAFDDPDLGVGLGINMMQQVVADIRRWIDSGIAIGHVAVNASAVELRRGDYAAMVLGALADAGVPPSYIQIEITESVFLGRGSTNVETALNTLSDAGIIIALDDFGTGFASLSHLKKFPIKLIKIDRSFVSGLEFNKDDAAIVGAVIGLAHNLGMQVVAEGVETPEQARLLRSMGCTLVQGYYFHRPSTAAAVISEVAMQREATKLARR